MALRIKSTWLGRFIDPVVELSGGADPDRQTFERGVDGLRYLNLTGQALALSQGELRLRGRFCRLLGEPVLSAFEHPDYSRQRVMVIAPHADDAELAAFGLYSGAEQSWIVTITAGEIEAGHYRQMGLDDVEASRLKGSLARLGQCQRAVVGRRACSNAVFNWATSACSCLPCRAHRPRP